ncbi:hypothetical protein NPIL_30751 [Nephila pilipes]|uniref:Uncharacterized protein n=1 Tax=Nephila pilipes TaxID=299642 RepID=A0A8X6T6B1_NEPPI|nr:hypothetical protein NPIL_30751 [Nephila pilipes]
MTEVNPVCEFFVSDCWNTGPLQEEEPMDWEDVPTLPEVIPPFYPIRPPRKMRNLVSKVSEPPVSANRFPNMRALVPKVRTPQAPEVTVMSFVFSVVSPFTFFVASFFF